MLLGLGIPVLAIAKIPYNISIIMTFICIVFVGLCSIWSYNLLKNLYNKQIGIKIQNYEDLCLNICGKKITYLLVINLSLYTLGLIVIHQVCIFRLLEGIINIIGGYNYESMINFEKETYWKDIWCKVFANFGIGILILFPLCLRKKEEIINKSSSIGFYSLLYIFLAMYIS